MLRVSACIPVFNGGETLEKAIESVRAQTLAPEEILVVDDGSTDGSAQLAEKLGCKVIRQENRGVAAARNVLLKEADGEVIALLDHDDAWTKEKLATQIAKLETSGVALVHSDCRFHYDDETVKERRLKIHPDHDAFEHVLPDNRIITSSAVFYRDLMIEAGGFAEDLSRCSDWYGWFMLAASHRFAHFPAIQVDYLVREDSLANSGLKFHSEKRRLLKEHILPRFDELFVRIEARDRRTYRRLIEEQIGVAASTMAKYLEAEGKKAEARELYREGLKLARKVPRVWTRWMKSLLR